MSDTPGTLPFGAAEILAAAAGAGRVLDVGCGSGRLTVALAGAGATVTGIDTNLGQLEQARGRAEEALQSYNPAVELAPGDSYPIFNRGRAHLALGHTEEAKADFTTASDPKFNQPTARKLAQKALDEMQ